VIARAPAGSDTVLTATLEIADNRRSHARRLFMQHRRPELYPAWLDHR
jgi:hypothetical protein